MTTLTTVPPPVVRPVPWHRLAWVAWRQSRTTLAAILGVVALVVVYFAINGHTIHSAYADWQACTPRRSSACEFMSTNFHNEYGSTGLIGFVQVLLPGIVGAFAGAPILARELETGTFRYAWTQGVGRVRWAIALMVPGLVVSVAALAALGAVISWRYRPLAAAGITSRLDPSLFPSSNPAVIGWTLAAFALGVLAGLVWRRVLPAVATTIALWFGLAVLVSLTLRWHYVAPLTTTKLEVPSTGMQVSQWWTRGGTHVSDSQLNQVLQDAGVHGTISSGNAHAQPAPGSKVADPIQYLVHHGYTQWTSYQPNGRYWTFQWIEFGWLTAFALLALGLSILLVRRRDG